MARKQATLSFPIGCQAKVFQAGISNGAEEAVGKSCRLDAEPSHFLTHLHIKAHSSSTNEQLAQLSRRGGSVDVLIGWICAACCASRQPGFLLDSSSLDAAPESPLLITTPHGPS